MNPNITIFFRQLNEEQILLLILSCIKKMYLNIPIHLFLIGGVGSSKTFIFKLIIQGLLRLYNKDLSLDLTKIKAVLIESRYKIAFNIDN
jgi:hypothetical protein